MRFESTEYRSLCYEIHLFLKRGPGKLFVITVRLWPRKEVAIYPLCNAEAAWVLGGECQDVPFGEITLPDILRVSVIHDGQADSLTGTI